MINGDKWRHFGLGLICLAQPIRKRNIQTATWWMHIRLPEYYTPGNLYELSNWWIGLCSQFHIYAFWPTSPLSVSIGNANDTFIAPLSARWHTRDVTYECDGVEIVYSKKGENWWRRTTGMGRQMWSSIYYYSIRVYLGRKCTHVCVGIRKCWNPHIVMYGLAIDVYIDFINGIHYARLIRKTELKACNGTIAIANLCIFIRGRDNNKRAVPCSVPGIRPLQSPPTISLTEYWHKLYA